MEELADPTSTARHFISEPQFHRSNAAAADGFLPPGEQWLYELKLDGYRVIAFKRNGDVHLRSRNDSDFNARYPGVAAALARLPDNTVPLHSRPRQDAGDARPRLKIRAQPGSLRMNDTRRNTRRLSWRQRKKLCRSALSFPP